MAFISGQQGNNALLSSSVEEVELREIGLDTGGHLVAVHGFKRSLPEERDKHLQAAHSLQYNSTASNDHISLLEDDISLPHTHYTEESPTHRRRHSTRLFAPLRRLQTWLADRKQRSSYHGWRMGVLIGCCTSFFVLCCNIGFLLIGATHLGGYSEGGVATLLSGDRAFISRCNTGLHVFINISSTLLLAGSNYTMQVMSSPTRDEIDRAHRRGDWLVVGLLSPHNWRRIAKKRVLICWILGLSSIPLHLFYNAATFKVLAQTGYSARGIHRYSSEYDRLAMNTLYVDFTNAQWKSHFAAYNISDGYMELVVVYDDVEFMEANKTVDNSTIARLDSFDDAPLNRGTPFRHEFFLAYELDATDWLPLRFYFKSLTSAAKLHIVHAFAVRAYAKDRIQLILYYIVVVIVANLFKLSIMLSLLIMDRSRYIVTLGDAVASFLASPDPTTEGRCLLENRQILDKIKPSTQAGKNHVGNTMSTRNNQTPDLSTDDSCNRRTLSYFALIRNEQARLILPFMIGLIALSFGFVFNAKSETGVGTWSWGVASTSTLSFTDTSVAATIFNAWLANAPQVVLSLCYTNLNSFCTAMTSAQEWNNLGIARKGLRVSEPRCEQRSTYFLQLP